MIDRQLAFDLPSSPNYAREDFLVADCNRRAWTLIEAWPNWPDRVLILFGAAGSGKSHLASIWAERAHARRATLEILSPAKTSEGLAGACVLVEDADRLGFDEARFFHLLNMVRAEQGWLVLTARRPLDEWGVHVPDLLSRLRMAPSSSLEEPDDNLIRALLTKHFIDRQLAVDSATVAYLALRLDRSFEAVRRVVESLDREALARARPITRSLIAEVLSRAGAEGDAPTF